MQFLGGLGLNMELYNLLFPFWDAKSAIKMEILTIGSLIITINFVIFQIMIEKKVDEYLI